ncbi:MAG: [protein-PII] uridylyltransferase [Hyphomicrobiaceae bacterium]|nr:[protein-PII] uridylyltransferase [Hyphomicrobiaceae bacterium]
MDRISDIEAPYFDPRAMREELTALFKETGDESLARPAVLARLKSLVADARAQAQARLMRDGLGRVCAAGLSEFQDELIRLIFDYTRFHVYHATANPSDAEQIAIVATGGYGRGLLAPGSDIDLLFLLPYKQTPWSESVAEYMLYLLWDLGFKVGHATRNVAQCVTLAGADMTIRTSLIDSRLILGDEALFSDFEQRFASEVVAGSARQFVAAKMAERSSRHRQSGESRYLVEPNVKDGKGGLRDLHTLHWLSKYVTGLVPGAEAVADGLFTRAEVATFRRCEDFLWTVRCHMHFETGRAEERLSFDLQPLIAEALGYRANASLRPVERFMKHYFMVTKDVGELTAILCSALEIQQLASAPRLPNFLNPLSWTLRRRVRRMTDFRIDDDLLNVASDRVFQTDPLNIIRLFLRAQETGTFFHPNAIRLMRRSLSLIDDRFREDPEANRIFLDLLTSRTAPATTLRRLNEAGVLGRFIPEFGRVVAMMQFNMYHHFTVDEHLIRTVGELTRIEAGELAEVLPLSTEIVSSIQNRRALYVAAFLHDVGKGQHEDHSIVGERVARQLCPRLGLSKAETDTVAWLVREHLTMSDVAQRRDLADPRTIRDFADIVQTPERLKLLVLLTVADIRAVGPGTWNSWKGQLLRELYYETEPLLTGGHTVSSRRARLAGAEQRLREALSDWPAADVETFVSNQYPDYWLRNDTAKQVEDAKLCRDAAREKKKLATAFSSDAFKGMTELTVLVPNHPRLLALLAGCCASAGANIIAAQISSTRNGFALDTFVLQRSFSADADETRRTSSIRRTIESVLKGEVRLRDLLASRKPAERRIQAFDVEPEVVISNALSDQYTVVEVTGLDRPGLLYDLTSTISDLKLDINSAHITTYGEKAVDVFYITDLMGKKIVDPNRQANIRKTLAGVLET